MMSKGGQQPVVCVVCQHPKVSAIFIGATDPQINNTWSVLLREVRGQVQQHQPSSAFPIMFKDISAQQKQLMLYVSWTQVIQERLFVHSAVINTSSAVRARLCFETSEVWTSPAGLHLKRAIQENAVNSLSASLNISFVWTPLTLRIRLSDTD